MCIYEDISAARQCNFQFAITYLCDSRILSLVEMKTNYETDWTSYVLFCPIRFHFKTNQYNNKCYTEFYRNKKLRMYPKRDY